jgi:hypothetical protein
MKETPTMVTVLITFETKAKQLEGFWRGCSWCGRRILVLFFWCRVDVKIEVKTYRNHCILLFVILWIDILLKKIVLIDLQNSTDN